MPPSIIPPAQLQSMMAEMRADQAYDAASRAETAPGYVRPGRRIARVVAWIAVVAVLVGGLIYLGPRLERLFNPTPVASLPQPTALALTPIPAPVAAPAAPQTPAISVPAAPAPAISVPAAPAPPMRKAIRPTLTPHRTAASGRPVTCVNGGPCSHADVQAAERRLRAAYDSARQAGVSSTVLTTYRQRWAHASSAAGSRPRTTVGVYRSLASELNAKAAHTHAQRHHNRHA